MPALACFLAARLGILARLRGAERHPPSTREAFSHGAIGRPVYTVQSRAGGQCWLMIGSPCLLEDPERSVITFKQIRDPRFPPGAHQTG